MKKVLVTVIVLVIAGAGVYYFKGLQTVPTSTSGNKAPTAVLIKFKNDRGTVASITANSVMLNFASSSPKTYSIASTTAITKETVFPLANLSKGTYVNVISDQNSGRLVSITVVKDKSMLMLARDLNQKWLVTGTVEKVSGKTVTVKDLMGTLKDFVLDSPTSLVTNGRVSVSSLKQGDTASITWFESSDGVANARVIFVPAS